MATGEANQFPEQERRTARRNDVLLPVVLQAAARQRCSARSRDISTGGTYLFVESDDLLPGTTVELTLSFPKELTGGAEMLMRARGKIIRVDKSSGDETRLLGVAVVFDTYDLIPSTSPSC
jgi:PilZ domain